MLDNFRFVISNIHKEPLYVEDKGLKVAWGIDELKKKIKMHPPWTKTWVLQEHTCTERTIHYNINDLEFNIAYSLTTTRASFWQIHIKIPLVTHWLHFFLFGS